MDPIIKNFVVSKVVEVNMDISNTAESSSMWILGLEAWAC